VKVRSEATKVNYQNGILKAALPKTEEAKVKEVKIE